MRVGTVIERSHIPLHKWLLAFRLMASSKKGISAHQLHRTLGITYKSAWFMAHRIREAMTDTDPSPLGGEGKIIEADETYYGRAGDPKDSDIRQRQGLAAQGRRRKDDRHDAGGARRQGSLGSYRPRQFRRAQPRVGAKAEAQSRLMTDDSRSYDRPGRRFAAHETVNHTAEEYVRSATAKRTPTRSKASTRFSSAA